MRRSFAVIVLLLIAGFQSLEAKETIQQLAERAEAAKPEDRPGLYVEIAERQLKAADELFGAGRNDEAMPALKDVTVFSEKAHDAAVDAPKRLKGTEIALRKMATKLRDIKRTLSFEEQPPVQAASDRLETLRSDLLAKMFARKK